MISPSLFFGLKMTHRHKVTPWLILVAFVAMAGLVGVAAYLWSGESPQRTPISEPTPGGTGDSVLPDETISEPSEVSEALTVAISPLRNLRPASVPTRFTGVVTAARTSQLSAKQLGRVEKVHVDMGDRVQSGQVVVELDDDALQAERNILAANLAAAEALLEELERGPREQEIAQSKSRVAEANANLRYREASLRRSEQLKNTQAISQQEFDESYNAFLVAEAQLETARKSLDLMEEGTRREQVVAQEAIVSGLKAQIAKVDVLLAEQRILAPFDGRIQKRFIDEGTVVNPGQSIIEIVEDDAKEIRVGLPSEIIDQVSAIDLQVSLAGKFLNAEVVRVAPAIDERTRKIEVVLRPLLIENEQDVVTKVSDKVGVSTEHSTSQWRIGSAVTVEVRKDDVEGGLWVPAHCLTTGTRGLWSVYLAMPKEDDASKGFCTTQRCEVEILRNAGDWVEIRGPLQGDEWLIVSGIHRLTNGIVVRVEQQEISLPSDLKKE